MAEAGTPGANTTAPPPPPPPPSAGSIACNATLPATCAPAAAVPPPPPSWTEPTGEDLSFYAGTVGNSADGWELAIALYFWAAVVVVSLATMVAVYFVLRLPDQHVHKHTHRRVWGCLPHETVQVLLGYVLLNWQDGEPVTPWAFLCDRHDLLAVLLSADVGRTAWVLRVLKLGVALSMCFLITMIFTSAGLDRMGRKVQIVDDTTLNVVVFYVMAVSASAFASFAVRFANMAAKAKGQTAIAVTAAAVATVIAVAVTAGVLAVEEKFAYSGASNSLIRAWWATSASAFGVSVAICFLATQPLSAAILYGLGIALLREAEGSLKPAGVLIRGTFWHTVFLVHCADLWMRRAQVGRFRKSASEFNIEAV